jgi:hypothetical protein
MPTRLLSPLLVKKVLKRTATGPLLMNEMLDFAAEEKSL